MKYKVFLAWQSQNRTTSKFIKAQLKKSVALLSERGYDIVLIERPTQEDSGAPNINSVIWEQISDSDVFIADISNIIQNDQTIISNPNVNVLGKITSEQFRMLSDGYNAEQRTIADQIPILQKQIEDLKASSTNVEHFVTISNKYTDLQDLTPEILRTFIDKIVIHERTEKWAKTAEQQIDIYFRYVGCIVTDPTD